MGGGERKEVARAASCPENGMPGQSLLKCQSALMRHRRTIF